MKMIHFGKWKGYSLALGIAAVAVAQPFRPMIVSGVSMTPTYASGELHLFDRSAKEFRLGDVVVVRSDEGTIVKRIAYGPGDTLYQSRVHGQVTDLIIVKIGKRPNKNIHKKILGENEFYLLGDNLDDSRDSRIFGTVGRDQILGRLIDWRPAPDRSLPAN